MSAGTREQQSEDVLDAGNPAPYRLRAPSQFFPAPTMLDLQMLVEQSGQRERVLRIAHAARQLEDNGERCDSLAELAQRAELTCAPPDDAVRAKTARLQRLLQEASAAAAELGAEVDEPRLRALYFGFCGCCQRTSAELRRAQLWRGEQ